MTEVADISSGVGVPRHMISVFDHASARIGQKQALALEDAILTEEMRRHYTDPPLALSPLYSPRIDPTIATFDPERLVMGVTLGDEVTTQTIEVHGNPADLARITGSRECLRRTIPYESLAVWLAPILAKQPLIFRVIVMEDAKNNILGAAVIGQDRGLLSPSASFTTCLDAFREFGVPLLRKRSDSDIVHLLSRANDVLYPDSEFSKKTGRNVPAYLYLDPESMFRMVELWDTYNGDPLAQQAIIDIVTPWVYPWGESVVDERYGEAASIARQVICPSETLLHLPDTREELLHIARVVTEKPDWLGKVIHNYHIVIQDTYGARSGEQFLWELPFANRVYQLGRNLVKSWLLHSDDPDFRPDLYNASFAALHDALNYLHGLDFPAATPPQLTMHGRLTDFTVARAQDSVSLVAIRPLVEMYFVYRIQEGIAKGTFHPGSFEQARDYFYKTIAVHLNANADAATGDTRQQIDGTKGILRALADYGSIAIDGVVVDMGCGKLKDGRVAPVLYPFIRELAPQGRIIAVDALPIEDPHWDGVHVVQKALEDPELTSVVDRKADAIVLLWSVINDVGPDKLQEVMNNLVRMLRKKEGDRPGGGLVLEVPLGYVEELMEKSQEDGLRAFPPAELHYPLGEGEVLDKPLSILYVYEMLVRAMAAGLKPLNIPPGKGALNVVFDYDTAAKKHRAFFVFERVGDPQQTLEQAALADGQVRVGVGRPGKQA